MSDFWNKLKPSSNDTPEVKKEINPKKSNDFWSSLKPAQQATPATQIDALADYDKTRRNALAKGQNAFSKQTATQAIDPTANVPLPPTVPAGAAALPKTMFDLPGTRLVRDNATGKLRQEAYDDQAPQDFKTPEFIQKVIDWKNKDLPKDENGNTILPKAGPFAQTAAGFEQAFEGDKVMAAKAAYGAAKGLAENGSSLHSAATGADYAFNPEHTGMGYMYDYGDSVPTDAFYQIGGAALGAGARALITGGKGASDSVKALAKISAQKAKLLAEKAGVSNLLPSSVKQKIGEVFDPQIAKIAAKELAAKEAVAAAKANIMPNAIKSSTYSGAKNAMGTVGGLGLTAAMNNTPGIELDKRIANADWLSPEQKQDVATLMYTGLGVGGGYGATKATSMLGNRYTSLGNIRDAVAPEGVKTYQKAREEDIALKAGETTSKVPNTEVDKKTGETPPTKDRDDVDTFTQPVPEAVQPTDNMEKNAGDVSGGNADLNTKNRALAINKAKETLNTTQQNLAKSKKELTKPLQGKTVKIVNPDSVKNADALKKAYTADEELPTSTPIEAPSETVSTIRASDNAHYKIDKENGDISLSRGKVADLAANDSLTDTTSNLITTINSLQGLDNYTPSAEYSARLKSLLPEEVSKELTPEAQNIKNKALEAAPTKEEGKVAEPNHITKGAEQLTNDLNGIFEEAHKTSQEGNTVPQEQLTNWLKDNGIDNIKKVQDKDGKLSAELVMHEMQSNKLLEGSTNLQAGRGRKKKTNSPSYNQGDMHAAYFLHTIEGEKSLSPANAEKLAKAFTDVKQTEQAKKASNEEVANLSTEAGDKINETLGNIFHPLPEAVRSAEDVTSNKEYQQQQGKLAEVSKFIGQALGDKGGENSFKTLMDTVQKPNANPEVKRKALSTLGTLFNHVGKVMKADTGAGFGHVPLANHFKELANTINDLALKHDINTHIQNSSPTDVAITPKQIRDFQKEIKADANNNWIELPNGKTVDLTYQGNSTNALQGVAKTIYNNDNLYAMHFLKGKEMPAASVMNLIDRMAKAISTGEVPFSQAEEWMTQINHMEKYKANISDKVQAFAKPLKNAIKNAIEEHYQGQGKGKLAVETYSNIAQAQRRNMEAKQTHPKFNYGKMGTAGNDVNVGEFGTGQSERSLPQKFEENLAVINKADQGLKQLGMQNGVSDSHVKPAREFQQLFTDLVRNNKSKANQEALIQQSGTMAELEGAPANKVYSALTDKTWSDVHKSLDPALLDSIKTGDTDNPLKGLKLGDRLISGTDNKLPEYFKALDSHLKDPKRVSPKEASIMQQQLHEDIRTGISSALNSTSERYIKDSNVRGGVSAIDKAIGNLGKVYSDSATVRSAVKGTPVEALIKEYATTPNKFKAILQYAGDSDNPIKSLLEREQSYQHIERNLLKNLKNDVADKGKTITPEMLDDISNFKGHGKIVNLFTNYVTSKFLSHGMRGAVHQTSKGMSSKSQEKAFITKKYLDLITKSEEAYPDDSGRTNGEAFRDIVQEARDELAKTAGFKNKVKNFAKGATDTGAISGGKAGNQFTGKDSKANIKFMTDSQEEE